MLLFALSCSVLACGQSEHTDQSFYAIGMRNTGTQKLSGAQVHFGAINSSAGYLMPGKGKADDGIQGPIPDRALVEWKTEDGEAHKLEVPVKAAVPDTFKDDVIWFEIDGVGKVSVVVKRRPGPER